MTNTVKVTRKELNSVGIYEAYVGCTLSDYLGPEAIAKKIGKYIRDFDEMSEDGVSLYFVGPFNTGKTMMANIIAKNLMCKGKVVMVIDMRDMVEFCWDNWRNKGDAREKFSEQILESDLLVIDDVGKETPSENTTSTLEFVLKHRVKRRRCTVLTSNKSKQLLAQDFGSSLKHLLNRAFVTVEFPVVDGLEDEMIVNLANKLED